MHSPQFEIQSLTAPYLPQLMAIDRACSSDPWPREEYARYICNGGRVRIGLDHFFVLGFIAYERRGNHYRIERLGVCPLARRLGIGRALLHKVTSLLHPHASPRAEIDVDEANLAMLLFLKACGFQAVALTRGQSDTIAMRYDLAPPRSVFQINEKTRGSRRRKAGRIADLKFFPGQSIE